MARPQRRGVRGILHARKVVLESLRPIVGKRELRKTLNTANPTEARRAHTEAMAQFEAILAAARAQLAGKTQRLPPRDLAALVGEWYRAEAAKIDAAPSSAETRELELGFLVDRVPGPIGGESDPQGLSERAFEPLPHDLAEAAE